MDRAGPPSSGATVRRCRASTSRADPLCWLRQASPNDPAAGSTVLCYLLNGGSLDLPSPLTEVFVLAGQVALGVDTLSPGDFTWFPAGAPTTHLQAIGDATLLLVLDAPSVPYGTSDYARRRFDTLHASWGYTNRVDGTDRLPLRPERTRGELTWLLRYPAGYGGCPTQAESISLECLVLAGDVLLPDLSAEPFTQWDYLRLAVGNTPAVWRTQGGCTLLLRTVASPTPEVPA